MKRTSYFSFGSTNDLPAMTYLPDVLSATSYPHTSRDTAPDKSIQQRQLFGGLVEVGTSEDEIDTRPKKRSKSTKKNPVEEQNPMSNLPKRQRGRPKVTTRDGTAAERRRTQIRLAQRAYRSRKENTITELTHRVETLQSTIQDLKQGFSALHQNLSTARVFDTNPVAAQQLNNLLQQLTDTFESVPPNPEKELEGEIEAVSEGGMEHNEQGMSAEHQTSVEDGHASPSTFEGQTSPTDEQAGTGMQHDLFDIDTAHLGFDLNGFNFTDHQNQTQLRMNYSSPDHMQSQQNDNELEKSLPERKALAVIERFPLKQQYTYSFQETTFSRRLHRFCLEHGYHQLNDPEVNPDWAWRKFRFTLHYATKARILNVINEMLTRGTDESLENFRTPFIHIGGAGLHFPRRDNFGNAIYPPNLLSPVRADSVWRLPDVHTISSETTLEGILKASGFDGEWFDSHDVQEYLKSKGIFPSPQASFVLVDSALVNPTLSDASRVATTTATTVTSHSSTSNSRSNSTGSSPQQHPDWEEKAMSSKSHMLLDERGIEPQDRINGWLNQNVTFDSDRYEQVANDALIGHIPTANRMVTIEIEKFLERLAEGSVCLGRAPGFRKDLVDHALFMAVQEAC